MLSRDSTLSLPKGSPLYPSNDGQANSWEIPYNELLLEKEIGQGAFGVVYLGKWFVLIAILYPYFFEELSDFLCIPCSSLLYSIQTGEAVMSL